MMRPNWFDAEFGALLEGATAEQALEEIARCPRIIQAVKSALEGYDENAKRKEFWAGPSRTQAIRSAIAEVLGEIR